MNAKIIEMSGQDQILITESFNLRNISQYNPSIIIEDRNINSIVRANVNRIANENHSLFFSRSNILVNNEL